MIHPHTRLSHVSDQVGLGVIATQPIPAGTIIWVRDALDQAIPRKRARALGPLYRQALRHFSFWEADGDLVLCWDHARFVNHSFEANCLGGGFDHFELAVRDIAPGDSITDDYATFGYASAFECGCGADTCRGRVSRLDARRMAPRWDELFRAAMARVSSVPQELAPLLAGSECFEAALRDPSAIPGHPPDWPSAEAPAVRLIRGTAGASLGRAPSS